MANIFYAAMISFFTLLSLGTALVAYLLPGMLRSFDAEMTKSKSFR